MREGDGEGVEVEGEEGEGEKASRTSAKVCCTAAGSECAFWCWEEE